MRWSAGSEAEPESATNTAEELSYSVILEVRRGPPPPTYNRLVEFHHSVTPLR